MFSLRLISEINMNKIFKNHILKLYSLETRIFSEEDLNGDLIKSLKSVPSVAEFLVKMEGIERYLFIKTILELVKRENHEIAHQPFPLGYLDPKILIDSNSQTEFLQKLTKNYPKKEVVTQAFNFPLDINEVIQKNDSSSILAALSGSYSHEQDPQLKLKLFKILAQDFDNLGEKISFDRVRLIYPYLPDLMLKSSHARYDLLRRMLDRTYPFTKENKYDGEGNDNWASEIKSIDS